MRIQKTQIKALAEKANVKVKSFLTLADEMFAYLGEEQPSIAAAKVIFYSRDV
jgi:hypothetical protein